MTAHKQHPDRSSIDATSRRSALLPVYAQLAVQPVSGHGSWLVDGDGTAWLDAYGGHAVAVTGHCHPDVVRAIAEQAATLLFYSAALPLAIRDQLATRLVELCPRPLDQVFFCNSGAEANENAFAIARKRTGRQRLVSVAGGFHGRTPSAIACTDGIRYEDAAQRAGIPLSTRVPFDDVAALQTAVDDTVAALIVEPVQGVQGARDCSSGFLAAARKRCTQVGAALIFDEIQCGVGRCGGFTAAAAYGVIPDAITMAKGLASGLPIGAVVVNPWLAEGLTTGDLGSTFGGGPVVCAAALATLTVIERDGLVSHAAAVGDYLRDGALKLGVVATHGRGLLIGLRLDRPAADVQRAMLTHRVVTGTSSDKHVLRIMPPLNFSFAEADIMLAALAEVLR